MIVPQKIKAILDPSATEFKCPGCLDVLKRDAAGFLDADWCEFCIEAYCMNCLENLHCENSTDGMHGMEEP